MIDQLNTPTLTGFVEKNIARALAAMQTAHPGKVTSYDSGTQRASVQPLIQRLFLDEFGKTQTETIPIVNEVPVIMPVKFPIAAGDIVMIVFASASLDAFIAEGSIRLVDPKDSRKFSLDDAVCFPWKVLGGPTIEITDTEILIGGSTALVTVTEHNAHAHLGVTTGGGTSGTPAVPAIGTLITKGA